MQLTGALWIGFMGCCVVHFPLWIGFMGCCVHFPLWIGFMGCCVYFPMLSSHTWHSHTNSSWAVVCISPCFPVEPDTDMQTVHRLLCVYYHAFQSYLTLTRKMFLWKMLTECASTAVSLGGTAYIPAVVVPSRGTPDGHNLQIWSKTNLRHFKTRQFNSKALFPSLLYCVI